MHPEFEVHLLNEQGIAKAKQAAEEFDALLTTLEELCSAPAPTSSTFTVGPGGCVSIPFITGVNARELAIVRTKLEEASFFAKKAIAKLLENQK